MDLIRASEGGSSWPGEDPDLERVGGRPGALLPPSPNEGPNHERAELHFFIRRRSIFMLRKMLYDKHA